jgi:hypothetical protein
MQQEIFSLKWNFFSTHLTSSISDVFTENTFSDVTLVSDDLIQFQAHKCVLSASSPVLKNLLLSNPHSHPLIYLRGVKHQELESILQFIYLGEARFYEGNMDRFMDAVKDLQIKQLAECFMTGNPFLNREEDATDHIISSTTTDPDIHANINDEYYADPQSISSTAEEILQLDMRTYNIDGESGSQMYNCDECEAVFKSHSGLLRHTRTKHEGIVYSCNQCEYKATQQGHLKAHIQSKHEGVTYNCNQCEYQAARQGTILRFTNNLNMKVLNIPVISVNIRQHSRAGLRLTDNLNTKV